MSLTKVFKRDFPDLDEAIVQGLPLRLVDDGVVGAENVVEPVEAVDEVLDGQADVVGQELETFELHDDGEASKSGADLWDEDRDDVLHRLVFEVDDGGRCGGRGVGTCRDAFGEAGLLDAVGKRGFAFDAFGGDALTVVACGAAGAG